MSIPKRVEREVGRKAAQILAAIIDRVNEGKAVAFGDDLGGNTLTIYIDNSHTHVGNFDGSFRECIDSLHGTLVGGYGLSWHTPAEPEEPTNA